MAYIATNAAVSASTPAMGYFEALVARFQAWRTYRRTVRELSALSDRELDDIGLTRSSINNYARAAR